MIVSAESYGQTVVLQCKGELTADALEAFKTAVEQALSDAQVRDLVLNLEAVPFVDSSGLEYLLELQERLEGRSGQVKLAAADAHVAKILEITRLDAVFERLSSPSEAIHGM
jgi:anti-anti-sigma factor